MGTSIDLSHLLTLPKSNAKTDPLLSAAGIPGENGSITWARNYERKLDAFDYEQLNALPFRYSETTAMLCKEGILKDKTAHELAKEYRRFKGLGRSTLYAYYTPLLEAAKKRTR
jgi:hypothetical protein